MKKIVPGFLLLLFLAFYSAAGGEGVTRCLLAGVDHFVSLPDTAPAAANNLRRMEGLLRAHLDREAEVTASLDGPGSVSKFRELFSETFSEAGPEDCSVIYFSTHGVRAEDGTAFLLSDGISEEGLSPETLREMLDTLPGEKILILDACYSGAFIGKGVRDGKNRLAGEKTRVLVSAGGEEDSYFWQDSSGDGGSYFLAAMESLLKDPETGDIDGDGYLSLQEVTDGIRALCGVSRAYCWPEDSGRALFRNDGEGPDGSPCSGLRFTTVEEDAFKPSAEIVFSASGPMHLWYQTVPWKEGKWDFESAVKLPDRERYEGSRGQIGPGEKNRTVRLSSVDGEKSGTALLQILSVTDGKTRPEGSRRMALTGDGEVSLTVDILGGTDETGGLIMADLPCFVTVTAENEAGETVRTMAKGEACIPDAGLYVYWSGLDENGAVCPAGIYRFRAVCTDAYGVREAFSEGFAIGEKEKGQSK